MAGSLALAVAVGIGMHVLREKILAEELPLTEAAPEPNATTQPHYDSTIETLSKKNRAIELPMALYKTSMTFARYIIRMYEDLTKPLSVDGLA